MGDTYGRSACRVVCKNGSLSSMDERNGQMCGCCQDSAHGVALDRFFARLVPDGDPLFRHRDEGADDMPAHVRAALTAVQLSVPIFEGRRVLSTWQGLCLWEHRTRPHRREMVIHFLGRGKG